MEESLIDLSCTVEVKPGERLKLPPALVEKVGPGQWNVTVRQCGQASPDPVRRHDAFLSGYSLGDEGLYDDFGG